MSSMGTLELSGATSFSVWGIPSDDMISISTLTHILQFIYWTSNSFRLEFREDRTGSPLAVAPLILPTAYCILLTFYLSLVTHHTFEP
jgi:hypothetical protein